jgi:two-component system phosphate regulon response regulator PhoB
MAAEILIVDDERAIRAGLRALLKTEGFAVRTARNGDEALAAFAQRRPDCVLLDVMMPGLNGFAVCEQMRRSDALVPIVFLTAKEEETDQVRAFGLGADDYIFKTAGEAELLARLRRALERAATFRQAASGARTARLGVLTVEFDALTVTGGAEETRLTKTEADFLWLLATERGRLYTYGEILDVLRGGGVTTTAVLQTHMSRLKRKLGRAGEMIFNERGLGYKLLS